MRTVAIKLLKPKATRSTRRFALEGECLEKLRGCPHVITVHRHDTSLWRECFLPVGYQHDAREGWEDGLEVPFLALECADKSLHCLLYKERSEWPTWQETIAIVSHVLAALTAAHGKGIVHRDVKPENILLHERVFKLSDFGIAKDLRAVNALTLNGQYGTDYYMAPEQLKNATITPKADTYVVGIILYELLAKEYPHGSWQLPSQINREIPKTLDYVVTRAMALDPDERFAAGEFLALLNAIAVLHGAERQYRWTVTKCEAKDVVPPLVAIIRNEDSKGISHVLRISAADTASQALGTLRPQEAASPLMHLLKESGVGKNARARAAWVLAKLGVHDIVPVLIGFLKTADESNYYVSVAIESLIELSAKEAIPDLLGLLKEEVAIRNSSAKRILMALAAVEAVPGLISLLRDADVGAEARGRAAWVLGELGAREAVPELRDALDAFKDEDVSFGIAEGSFRIAEALAKLHSREGVSFTLGTTRQNPWTSLIALNALRRPECWEALKGAACLGESKFATNIEFLDVVAEKIGMRLDISPLEDENWLTHGRWIGKCSQLRCLEELVQQNYDIVLETDVIRVLPRGKAWIFWAEWWVGELSKKEIPDLLKLLKESATESRWQFAGEALVALASVEAVPGLISLLRDANVGAETRARAAYVLGELGAREAVPELRDALKDNASESIRIDIAMALAKLHSRDGARILAELQKHVWDAGRYLFTLNALRRPVCWEALKGTGSLGESKFRTNRELLDVVAKKAGMRLDISALDDENWLAHGQWMGKCSLLRCLEELSQGSLDIVLETDSIRVLPRGKALRLWAEWWVGEMQREKASQKELRLNQLQSNTDLSSGDSTPEAAP